MQETTWRIDDVTHDRMSHDHQQISVVDKENDA